MNLRSSLNAGLLLGTILAGTGGAYAVAQQPPPVPVTSDTPAATPKPMPPETTPVQGTAPAAAMTKDQLKAQRKQQKAEEKAASSSAKAAKTNAKAKKQSDKAIQDREKASSSAAPPPVAPNR